MRVRKAIALAAALGLAVMVAFVVAGTAAAGTINQVTCPLPGFNPTHFGIEEGTTVTCTVDAVGVTGSPATIDVIIRSSDFGNTTVTGTLLSGTTYQFTYTAPGAEACNTSNIGYQQDGGTPKDAHAGFAYLNGGVLDSSCGAPPPAESAVMTTVHLGASDSGSPVVVDNTNMAPLGGKVHDSAKVTITGGVAAPAGSTVTFLFFSNNDCTGVSADGMTVAADGPSPVVLDPGLVEPASGGLEAGSYAFQAFFTSGDSTKVQDADGACEPFKVDQGDTSTSTALKNAADESPIADGSLVALGTAVHDTATVTGSPFTPTGTVTYRFYVAKDCAGLAVSEQTVTLNADGSVPASAATEALHPGDYGFIANYSGDSNYRGSVGDCEPFSVDQGDTATSTALKNAADESAIADGATVPLGTSVHDTATVSGSPFTPTGTVTYHFFIGKDCAVVTDADEIVTLAGGSVPNSSPTVALHPGDYGFKAEYSGDANYRGSTSDCEPFTVDQGTTQTTTQVHDAGHNDITGKTVPNGSFVHDSATVTGTPTAFPLTGTVTYEFFANGTCTGTALSAETEAVGSESTPQQLSSGAYSYLASYNGSADYKASTGVCEPFAVRTPGKTMGFWGNKNGQARIAAAGGYAANAVQLGRGSNIDTSAESLKVLPNSLNACGKGTPQIFSVGGSTSSASCTVASGVNVNSLNTLAAQTLALGYNLNPALLPGFGGQTVGGMGCGLAGTGLSPSSSVSAAFAAAVALINGSVAGGGTTQAQIGAMNSLLGCVNSEA